ncbi:MAG: diphosphomevalonate decarboxylase [Chloroflexi bacterium RBG_13_50_21]|nr:MAG: diphosphomevalonate decarboxylase [Chloroflexi bacterium RBG_13_50_21]
MPSRRAAAFAHPNIALIKYWGDIDSDLHIPANGSISMNLAGLTTRTTVSFDTSLSQDQFILNGEPTTGKALERVSTFLNRVRLLAGMTTFANVESQNNFPAGVGVASSASGFAALSLAATHAAGLELDEKDLSRLARTGSGSACRSIPGGFVEWHAGRDNHDSYAYSIAPPDYWDVVDCIALVSRDEKAINSNRGHVLAATSMLQAARLADSPRRLSLCRNAILGRDFDALTDMAELDSNLMHAIMITSKPPLLYWQPGTLAIMHAVHGWRKVGIPVCFTIDAGPNVHVLCLGGQEDKIIEWLQQLPGVIQVLTAHPGGPAALEQTHLNQAGTIF